MQKFINRPVDTELSAEERTEKEKSNEVKKQKAIEGIRKNLEGRMAQTQKEIAGDPTNQFLGEVLNILRTLSAITDNDALLEEVKKISEENIKMRESQPRYSNFGGLHLKDDPVLSGAAVAGLAGGLVGGRSGAARGAKIFDRADLFGAAFYNCRLEVDFSGIGLAAEEETTTRENKKKMREILKSIKFYNCIFSKDCILPEGFEHAQYENCHFEGRDFQNIKIPELGRLNLSDPDNEKKFAAALQKKFPGCTFDEHCRPESLITRVKPGNDVHEPISATHLNPPVHGLGGGPGLTGAG
jgi:hypothetical protein